MFVTYPQFQVKCPRDLNYEGEASGWAAVMCRDQQGWFSLTIQSNEFSTTQNILTPYPYGIGTIAKNIAEHKLSVSCIQCALFNKQSNSWAFHKVEEVWSIKPDALKDEFEELFRLEGQGLLDSFGELVELEPGDKLELIYQSPRI